MTKESSPPAFGEAVPSREKSSSDNEPEQPATAMLALDGQADLAAEPADPAQDDEGAQAQTFASAALGRDGSDAGLSDTTKVHSGDVNDDVPDLVDHMRAMEASGRIDMDAYRGERNDDDEEDSLGPAGAEE